MAKFELDPRFDPAIHPEFKEPSFVPVTMEAARQERDGANGLVWWRPTGVITETPETDAVMVRRG